MFTLILKGVQTKLDTLNLDYSLSLLFILSLLICCILGCSKNSSSTDEVPLSAQELLKKLNQWNNDELTALEQSNNNPLRIVSGETVAWVKLRKRELNELGYLVKWNIDKKIYELHIIEK